GLSSREAEWLEAQKILTSVDLVVAAKLQLAFLAAVDNNRWLYEETALVNCIYRYQKRMSIIIDDVLEWSPKLALHSMK
ncbi:Glycine-rich domain-containing protein 1, partial [Linum perenne]